MENAHFIYPSQKCRQCYGAWEVSVVSFVGLYSERAWIRGRGSEKVPRTAAAHVALPETGVSKYAVQREVFIHLTSYSSYSMEANCKIRAMGSLSSFSTVK